MVSLSYLQLSVIALATTALAESGSNSSQGDAAVPAPYSPHYYPSPQGGRTQDDDWAEAYEKARSFVSKLSLPEKVNLTTGSGDFADCSGNTGDLLDQDGFWGLCLQDGPLGVRTTDLVTGYPSGVSAGATFNKKLMYQRGQAIASEFRGKGVDVMLGPVVGPLGLKALGGRNWESFGADPYLQGVAGAQTVKGIHDGGVIANAKHFVANEQETFRMNISSNLGDRALHELYVRPFADLIHAGAPSVMCSYNLLNESFSCENSYTLNHILKDELGFQGFVVSDWGATHSGVNAVTSGLDMDMPHTGFFGANLTAAVLNGTVPVERIDDMATRIMAAFYKTNLDTIRKERGPPNFSAVTDLTYDHQYPTLKQGPIVQKNKHVDVRSKDNYKVAYRTGLEAVVLLKNTNNTLPLANTEDKPLKKLAVLGAGARPNSAGTSCSIFGCVTALGMFDGASQLGWGSGAVQYPYFISPIEGINEHARKQWMTVEYNFGLNTSSTSFMRTASSSEVNIIYALANGGEFLDRKSLTLELKADETILAATKLNKNNVVVVNSVGQVDMSKWIDNENVTAVVFVPPAGQDTGMVIADVIFGKHNPSGRLPFTIARNISDYVPLSDGSELVNNFPQDDLVGDSDIYVDYARFDHMNVDPLFEFGFGLSYSEFKLSDIQVKTIKEPSEHLPKPKSLRPVVPSDEKPDPKDSVFPEGFSRVPGYLYSWINSTDEIYTDGGYKFPDGYTTQQKNESSLAGGASGGNPALWEKAYEVRAIITNKGSRAGQFVPQLYLSYPKCSYETPLKTLRGFEKIDLQPGQSESVQFNLLTRDLTVWDVKTGSWVVPRGEYKIYVGSSSKNLELETTIKL